MNTWWLAIRPKTLLASIGPVLLATALATKTVDINYAIFLATLSCALLLQISVNLANDLFDGLSGVDNDQRLGPIRTLHSGLVTPKQLKLVLSITTLFSISIGCYLVYQGGFIFLVLGALSILGVYGYSAGPFPLASHGLGEVTVFLFFGLVAVLGSYYLQTYSINLTAVGFAFCVGLLNAALMLVNNIRDIESDRLANKFTLAVKLGDVRTRQLYNWLIFIALFIHLFVGYPEASIQFIPLIICLILLPNLVNGINRRRGSELNQLLADTAKFGFVYCISTSLCLLFS